MSPVSIDAQNHDWAWTLTGSETGPEFRALNRVLEEAQRFCDELMDGGKPRWITFVGASGCGKTYIARRICDFVRKHGEEVYNRGRTDDRVHTLWGYAQEAGFFNKWLKLFDATRSGDYGPITRAGSDWFKCVDDLGAEGMDKDGSVYQHSRNMMGKLADARVGKWTVFTSNFDRKQIADLFDPRIASRLTRDGNMIVDLTGVRDFQLRREATAGYPQTR
jgi:hypothetical protein